MWPWQAAFPRSLTNVGWLLLGHSVWDSSGGCLQKCWAAGFPLGWSKSEDSFFHSAPQLSIPVSKVMKVTSSEEGGTRSWDCSWALAVELWSFIPAGHLSLLSHISSSVGYSFLKSQQWVPVLKEPVCPEEWGIMRLLACTVPLWYSCFSSSISQALFAVWCLCLVSTRVDGAQCGTTRKSLLGKDKQYRHLSLDGQRRGCLYPALSQITRKDFEVQK